MHRSPYGDTESSFEGNGRRSSKSVQSAVGGGPHPEASRRRARIARQFRQQFEDVGENGHDLSNKNNRASLLLSLHNSAAGIIYSNHYDQREERVFFSQTTFKSYTLSLMPFFHFIPRALFATRV